MTDNTSIPRQMNNCDFRESICIHRNLILTISISLEKGSLSMGCVHVSEFSLTRSSVFLHGEERGVYDYGICV